MIQDALRRLAAGELVLLYDFDDREQETDFAIRSDRVRREDICLMRHDGGGLICTAIAHRAAQELGIPFAREVLRNCAMVEKIGEIPYDPHNNSSFSLWVNHRETFTGITDRDRTLTINRIAEVVADALNGKNPSFSAGFRTPGHVPILIAAEHLLSQRHGQTELSVAMAEMAGIVPAVTICEMLDDTTGDALRKRDAKRYAEKHHLAFIEGADVLALWEETQDS
ncbi:MAG: 3,4-dihydroxy-2-butanone-4-phosphate synthase [Methanospirillaceae archaeon]|nr:3,4-dihydroxy-2-butanone-4-phosphate synthase [Methanospirillaceae archaeon]